MSRQDKTTQKLSDHRYLITFVMLVTCLVFLSRSFSSNFFKRQAEFPTVVDFAEIAATGKRQNEFLGLTGYSLGMQEFMHKYKEGHRNRGTFIDVYFPLKTKSENQPQNYNCLLKVKLSTTRNGGGARVQNENRQLIKSLHGRTRLAGTFQPVLDLPKGIYDMYPELRGKRNNTLVFHFGQRPKNYFLVDSFLMVLCLGVSATTFASWLTWSPPSLSPSESIEEVESNESHSSLR